jgi:predicted nucleic acid-binding protein
MASTLTPTSRVFVDSSVLMSAVLSETGSAHDLILLGTEGRIALVISTYVVSEVERNLGRKAPDKLPHLRRIFDDCSFEIAEPSPELVARETANIESKDAGIVAAAVVGNVHFLVTYDVKHLLAQATQIETRHGIVVCSPAVAIASMLNAE